MPGESWSPTSLLVSVLSACGVVALAASALVAVAAAAVPLVAVAATAASLVAVAAAAAAAAAAILLVAAAAAAAASSVAAAATPHEGRACPAVCTVAASLLQLMGAGRAPQGVEGALLGGGRGRDNG